MGILDIDLKQSYFYEIIDRIFFTKMKSERLGIAGKIA